MSFTDPCIGSRFAGLVYPLSYGKWLGEVFDKDMAQGFGSEREAKKWVEGNI